VQLDLAGRRCTYASAGHVAGLLVDPAGRLKARLPASGPPLGILPGVEFVADRSPTVAPGDLLVLVTDGVTECRDGDDAELDEAGVLAVVGERPGATAAEVVEALHARVRLRSGSAGPRDDVTVLACRWLNA
jgi:sigma-B regulation protein RsbU (phosphoserine phosphatase)